MFVKAIVSHFEPKKEKGHAFAPSNIALCKYWGKRDEMLNLPETSSLSISLGRLGTETEITLLSSSEDVYVYDDELIKAATPFYDRLKQFLDLFRGEKKQAFKIRTRNTVPLAAGLASSASGMAALVLALNDLFAWRLDSKKLSMLARLGSGSASRSVCSGFVLWHRGHDAEGFDSFAESMPVEWPSLRVGIVYVSTDQKAISSREAMKRSRDTSPFYAYWPTVVKADFIALQSAITAKDFRALGQLAERNAQALHALMHTATPPVNYDLPETLLAKKTIWQLREKGLPVYFTQDAGPNLKILFEEKNEKAILDAFPDLVVINPFREDS